MIRRILQGRAKALLNSGEYFFRPDFEDVLQGLVLEYVPNGVYVWKLCFPLFDPFGPNLTFSERLRARGGFVAKGEMNEEEVVDFALTSPEAHAVFDRRKSMDLSEFVRDIELLPYDWRSTRVALVYAASLAMLGQDARAVSLMDRFPAASILGGSDLGAYGTLRTSLHEGRESVRALLRRVRRENLRTLGLAE